MNHVIYFGKHPRPGVFKIEVRPGLTLYFDKEGNTHSLASLLPIARLDLIDALGSIQCNRRQAVQ